MRKFTVDPNGYKGTWRINDRAYVGKSEVKLEVGTYTIELACGTPYQMTVPSAGNPTGSIGAYNVNSKAFEFNTKSISIDPNGYDWIEGHFGILNGPKLARNQPLTLNLVADATYRFVVAYGATFSFELDKDGNIDVKGAAMPSIDSKGLVLQVMDMTVVASGYDWVEGTFGIHYGPKLEKGGSGKLKLVRTLNYNFSVAYNSVFPFSLGANDDVDAPTGAAIGSKKTLTLNVTDIEIEDGGYEWVKGFFGIQYGPQSVKPPSGTLTTLKVVKDVKYQFVVAYAASFKFSVDKDGKVIVKNKSAKELNDKLTLNLTDLKIETAAYQWVEGFLGIQYGPQYKKGTSGKTIEVVPAVDYFMAVALNAKFRFSINGYGDVSVGSTSAVGGKESIRLQTAGLEFKPADPLFSVKVHYGPQLIGEGTLELVRNVEYSANINGEETKLSVTNS